MRRWCLMVAVALAGFGAVSASAATAAPYVVVVGDQADPSSEAAAVGAAPDYLYTAGVRGFAGNLTAGQVSKLRQDPSVRLVKRDSGKLHIAFLTPPPGTPHLNEFPQFLPWSVDRVDADKSRTANINQRRDPVRADVAVFDTGVEAKNVDLNVAGGVNCLDPKLRGSWDDPNGHGTEVAGQAAAVDNRYGVVGVAPGARIWSVRVADNDGNVSDAALLCGIDWTLKHRPMIDVANLSLSGDGPADDGDCGRIVRDLIHEAICRSVRAGTTYVVAAGNDAVDDATTIPANYDEVITVSGMSDSDGQPGGQGKTSCLGTDDDVFAFFSNWGADVDISAPAVCNETTYPGSYEYIDSGTSFATPLVSGAVALFRDRHRLATPAQVRAAIIANREPTPLAGDPDGINEGVLNVASF